MRLLPVVSSSRVAHLQHRARTALALASDPATRVLVATALAAGLGGMGAFLEGCHRASSLEAPDAAPSTSSGEPLEVVLRRAEDQRLPSAVPEHARTSTSPTVRRLAARALARMGAAARPELMRALHDDDGEVVAWAAFGLGLGCRGAEEATVRALAARASGVMELGGPDAGGGWEGGAPGAVVDAGVGNELGATFALARAVGRCGGPVAEATLTSWLEEPALSAAAALGLADLGARQGRLEDATLAALLASSTRPRPLLESLAPFGRLPRVSEPWASRVLAAAQSTMRGPRTPERIFALRALARLVPLPVDVLGAAAMDVKLTLAERAEAVRALRAGGPRGRDALAEPVVAWAASLEASAVAESGAAPGRGTLRKDEAVLLEIALGAMDSAGPPAVRRALQRLAALAVPAARGEAKRAYALRCAAAAALAEGAYEAEGLTACAPADSVWWGLARLHALARRSLLGARQAAWAKLAEQGPPRVREAALLTLETHPELGAAARHALATALRAKVAGLVSVSADVLHRHPERAFVPSAEARRNASDPAVTAVTPGRDVDPAIREALGEAFTHPWAEDRVEARLSLMDAGTTLLAPGIREFLTAMCGDRTGVLRERAELRLRALGEKGAACPAPKAAPPPAAEVTAPLPRDTGIELVTEAGRLGLVLDAQRAPVAAARFVALARAGFFRGIVVHRVVPAFVVQLGDPDGDGFGGSGTLLRCETSPLPFGPLDVGIATAGRDTGSSQLFVTLSRTPHLDGEYARIGRAHGDWHLVSEGDVVHEVRVVE